MTENDSSDDIFDKDLGMVSVTMVHSSEEESKLIRELLQKSIEKRFNSFTLDLSDLTIQSQCVFLKALCFLIELGHPSNPSEMDLCVYVLNK